MRLNWYLPFRPRAGARAADRQGGVIRRILRLLGPTWLASPVRRIIQIACFLAFLGLFFYVCWPYTAQPASRVWPGWFPDDVDAKTGTVTVVADQPPAEPVRRGKIVHVVDADRDGRPRLGLFRVDRVEAEELELVSVEPLSDKETERLLNSLGPWSLSDAWPSHYADSLQAKEKLPAETFLAMDPLVSISTATAARTWVWSLAWAGIVLLVSIVIPRGFCAYLCPLGTIVDLFDWAIGKRVALFRVPADGWWVHVKYYLLLAVLIAALFGVLLSGFVAAIPVVTRGMAFLLSPLQMGATRAWHQIPSLHAGHVVSIVLFFIVLGLGLLRPRFWCKYVCPTGAVFSVGTFFRLDERKVESSCIHCGRCAEICPFDAIKADFTTRAGDCTFCQSCGGVCPKGSIKFVGRWSRGDLKAANDPPTGETPLGRRGFLASAAGSVAGAAGGLGAATAINAFGAQLHDPAAPHIVRPPGSVPEKRFLQLCIRCGECFQACPNNVLQPLGFAQGWEGLWTPQVVADWSGCEPSCNNCGQVCPTGAIRALHLEDEKRWARMGLAVVNSQTCLPHAGRENCRLCVDECAAAGYNAIEFVGVGTQTDPFGQPIADSGFLAPVVRPHKCVGCGLCQTRCYAINSKTKGLLSESAIQVEAGEGREHRLMSGSYAALREEEERQRKERQRRLSEQSGVEDSYLPGFLKSPP